MLGTYIVRASDRGTFTLCSGQTLSSVQHDHNQKQMMESQDEKRAQPY